MNKESTPYRAVIQFRRYIFEELSFFYRGYGDDEEETNTVGPIPTVFQVNVGMDREEPSIFKGYIKLSCHVNEESMSQLPFSISAIMRGEFTIDPDISDEKAKKLLQINGVAVMFPFLRASIANLTAAAGVDAMILPLFDISKLAKDEEVEHP